MKLSRHLGRTQREDPKDAQTVSHKLMLRAGYLKQVTAGIYTYLPLLHRVMRKISQIVREEMDRAGAEELTMPALQPKELWVESGRWERYTKVDGIMFAFRDRREGEVCLGPTHEEVITDIVRKEVSSYKELPKTLYQIQTKFRDEIRPRFGLMRGREFLMKDAYSFDLSTEGLDRSYNAMYEAYSRAFSRIGLDFRAVEADTGAIGGSGSHEFMVLAESGEDTVMYCDSCAYAANLEKADSKLSLVTQDESPQPMQRVHGPGLIGVDKLAEFLKIPVWKTTKTILFDADGQLVAVMVRGDSEVSEIKVQNKLNCKVLRLLSAEEITKHTGAAVGYAGPIGLPKNAVLLADTYVGGRTNFECGANETDYHNINVNFGRDLPALEFHDLKKAKKGDGCPRCEKGKLLEARGIEVGHIFKLGTKYSKIMNCTYLDASAQKCEMVMGCYGIGISRIAAAAIEQRNDKDGMMWPLSIAPYHLHLVGLNLDESAMSTQVENIYQEFLKAGLEVLFDDRDARPGEKFSDADLIGIPARATVSKRSLESGGVEFKWRNEGKEKAKIMSVAEVITAVRAQVEQASVMRA